MKRTFTLLIVLGSLALVGSAAAKGPFTVRICGSSGCASVEQEIAGREPDALGSVLLAASDRGLLKAPTVGTPAPAPYLSLRIEEWVEAPTFYYVPSLRLLRMAPYWFEAPDPFVRRMQAVAARLRPWPAPRLTGVLVGARRAANPSAYAALLGPLPRASVPTDAGSPLKITLVATRPWPDEFVTYFPSVHLVYRDSQWLRMPARLVTAAEQDAGLARPAGSNSGSGSLPWIVAGGLASLLLAAMAGLTLRFRRIGHTARTP